MPRRPARHHTSSAAIQRVADKYAYHFSRLYLESVRGIRAQLTDDMLDHAINNFGAHGELHDLIGAQLIAKAAPPEGYTDAYANILSDVVTETAPSLATSLNLTSPQVVRWANKRTANLVTRVTTDTRKAIRSAITQGVRGELDRKEVRDLIKNVVGLDSQRASALVNFTRGVFGVPDRKPTDDIIEPTDTQVAIVDRYADRLLTQRAETIARTETMSASNAGQQETWREAAAQGYIDPSSFQQEWMVTDDDRLCPECEPMDKERTGLDGNFPGDGGDGPPLHPNCRCAIVSVDELPAELDQPPTEEPTTPLEGVDYPSEDVIAAIKEYTAKGGPLESQYSATPEQREALNQWVASGTVTDPVTRGISVSDAKFEELFPAGAPQPGDTISSSGITSWSTDPSRAAGYGSGGDNVLKMTTDGEVVGRDISMHSVYPEEKEVLLAPNTVTVSDARYESTIWKLTVEPQAPEEISLVPEAGP